MKRGRHTRSGFTLVEMLVVMSIIAILLGMGVVMFASLAHRDRLGGTTRALTGGLRRAQSQAIIERKPVRFRFNAEQGCFYAIREGDGPNVNGIYGDHPTFLATAALTGSDIDFLEGNVIREPLLGGNGTPDTPAPLANDDTWYDLSTGAYPGPATLLPGQLLVLPGVDAVLDTSPVADDEIAYTRREDCFLDTPEYVDDDILVAREDSMAPGSWEVLDWDVIFDSNGRVSFPGAIATQMRRIRLATQAGDLGTVQIRILATTGEILLDEL